MWAYALYTTLNLLFCGTDQASTLKSSPYKDPNLPIYFSNIPSGASPGSICWINRTSTCHSTCATVIILNYCRDAQFRRQTKAKTPQNPRGTYFCVDIPQPWIHAIQWEQQFLLHTLHRRHPPEWRRFTSLILFLRKLCGNLQTRILPHKPLKQGFVGLCRPLWLCHPPRSWMRICWV